MECFSTYDLPVSRKVSFWNEISSDIFAAMEVEPRDAQAFEGRLSRASLGSLTLMEVHSAAARIRRTRSHIARATESSLLLLAPLQRALQVRVDHGPTVNVGCGEFCLIDHARPYEVAHGDGARALCVDIPRPLFGADDVARAALAGRLMRPDSASARLLIALLRAIGAEFHLGHAGTFAPEAAEGLWNLILAAYTPVADRTGERCLAASVRNVRADIDANLGDPGLRPADVAARCGFSERYLRTVLRSAGEPFSEYLLRRRLEQCARLLRDAAWDTRTVTEIAFYSGFCDASHFGRAFKARFNLAPRAYRRSSR